MHTLYGTLTFCQYIHHCQTSMSAESHKIVTGEASETDEENETSAGSLKESIENVCEYEDFLNVFVSFLYLGTELKYDGPKFSDPRRSI